MATSGSFLDKNGFTYFWSKLKALLNGKQDTLTFDTAPTSGSSNMVTSGGVYTGIYSFELAKTLPDKTDPNTGTLYCDIFEADPGWWKRATNLVRVRNNPPGTSGTGFLIHVINTTLGNPQRKMVFFYPQSSETVGEIYLATQTSNGWSSWYKYTGTLVT